MANVPLVIHIVIRNREKVFFNADALAITSKNDKGEFDILPNHSNFISIIQDYVRIVTLDKQKKVFAITKGVMKVTDNTASVYLGIVPQDHISA